MNTIFVGMLQDGFLAAVAAIGFGSISNIPLRAFGGCAFLGALGHAVRFVMMNGFDMNIIFASFLGALAIGLVSIPASRYLRCPAESLSSPALLPMIPGMYAYRAVQALLECMKIDGEMNFMHHFYLLSYNWMVCTMIIVLMVIGITVPIFIFNRISFRATKR